MGVEVTLAALDSESFTGICTSVAALGDLGQDDLAATNGLESQPALYDRVLASYISLDCDPELRRLTALLKEAGMPCHEHGSRSLTTEVPLAGSQLKCVLRPLVTCLSFIIHLRGVKPSSEERLTELLTLNRTAVVARCGLDPHGDIALLYEVPAPFGGMLDHLVAQFTALLPGALSAGRS